MGSRKHINLPTDLLRTFITVIDLGGFTRAGDALNRTQPAISLQVRRLEELVGTKLILHDGRALKLSDAGVSLAAYARQILRLNDEAVSRFHKINALGALRVGLPTDYVTAFLQEGLTNFMRDNKNVEVEIHCDLSRHLLDLLSRDQLDLTVALIREDEHNYLVKAWEEQPIWTTSAAGASYTRDPVPLVAHPEGCEYRNRMVAALNATGRSWRIAYSNPGISGLQNAVENDLGVSALTHKTQSDSMRILNEDDGFPTLEKIRIGMFYKHARMTDAGLMLVNHLIECLDEASDQHFMPSAHPVS